MTGTRDRGDKILPLLSSIFDGDLDDFEFVVVDQSDDDATEIAVKPYCDDPRFTYIRQAQPGVSRARNLAIANTTAPVIAVTDDDCVAPPTWLRAITAPFDRDPEVGVVFCSVEPAPEPPTEPGHTPQVTFERNRTLTNAREVWLDARTGMYLGAGMAVRRTAFEAVGGFDEMLGPGARFGAAEDNDLSWRCVLAGWSLHQTADIAVTHDGFRNLEELRELTVRNFYGVGGTFAKYLLAREFSIVPLVADWLVRFGIVDPARQLLAGGRPSGLRRPLMIMRGLFDGLRVPIDRATLTYHPNR